MKKIISFSLYGSEPLYLEGAVKNAELCPRVFPGWTCRFYISQEIDTELIDRLKKLGAEVCPRRRNDATDGMFWRFEPAGEADVEAMIVRDSDSRLCDRDFQCVQQWLKSGKTFHFLRDHPSQRKPILGGLWGCRNNAIPDIKQQIQAWKQKADKGNDQHFLMHRIYPWASLDCFIQTPFTRYRGEQIHPITKSRSEAWDYLGRPVEIDRENKAPAEALDIQKSLKRPLRDFKLPTAVRLRTWLYRIRNKIGV